MYNATFISKSIIIFLEYKMKILLTVNKSVSCFEQDLQFFEKLRLMYPEIQFEIAENVEQESRFIADSDIYYGSITNEVFSNRKK